MLARQSASLVARRAPQKLIHARGVHIDNTVYNVRLPDNRQLPRGHQDNSYQPQIYLFRRWLIFLAEYAVQLPEQANVCSKGCSVLHSRIWDSIRRSEIPAVRQ
jgi:hypothetical protein